MDITLENEVPIQVENWKYDYNLNPSGSKNPLKFWVWIFSDKEPPLKHIYSSYLTNVSLNLIFFDLITTISNDYENLKLVLNEIQVTNKRYRKMLINL